jgi:hypothetical protein
MPYIPPYGFIEGLLEDLIEGPIEENLPLDR